MEIPKQDRRCLDKYLIKSFSDNISISDAMRNLNITKNLMYITPDSLMQTFMGRSQTKNSITSDRTDSAGYDKTMKRAFYILKEFYKSVSNKPFYKEYIYYPIYVEKIEALVPEQTKDNQIMNYSFIILANDLDKELKIDEIRYDANATLNFLFIFSELFSGFDSRQPKTLNELNSHDLNFMIKFYQFVEKTGKQPIDVITDLYKFIHVLSQMTSRNSADVQKAVNQYFDKTKIDAFRKYQGIMKGTFMREFMRPGSVQDDKFRDSFLKMLQSMFDQSGFEDLFGDIKNEDVGYRKQVIYNSNKYQEILNIAGELVKYNNIPVKDIVINDRIDFDFKLESGGYTIETQSALLNQKYQTYFKNFITDMDTFLSTTLKLSLRQEAQELSNLDTGGNADQISQLRKELAIQINEIKAKDKEHKRLKGTYNHNINIVNNSNFQSNSPAGMQILDTLRNVDDELVRIVNELNQHQMQADHLRLALTNLENSQAIITNSAVSGLSTDIVDSAVKEILSSISGDLVFLYDDLKELFINETLIQQIIDNPVNNTVDFESIKKLTSGPVELKEFLETLEIDFETIGEGIYNAVRDHLLTYEDQLTQAAQQFIAQGKTPSQQRVKSAIVSRFTSEGAKAGLIKEFSQAVKSRAIGSVLKNIQRSFSKKRYKQQIAQDDKISELHPLIRKMLRNPQNFRAFIIDFDTVENLYQLWYIAATKKFLAGLIPRVPQKLSSPKNRMEFVIEDLLGLHANPVWILSKTRLYLSMPDYLSLTSTKMLQSIDKAELQGICRIDYKDYWDERKMGGILTMGDHKKEQDAVTAAKEALKKAEKALRAGPTKTGPSKQLLQDMYDKKVVALKHAEEKLAKVKQASKGVPNLFDQSPEEKPLLDQREADSLMKNKLDDITGAQLPTKSFDDQVAEKIEHDMDELLKDSEPEPYRPPEYQPPRPLFDSNGQPIVDPLEQRDQRSR